jgi:hypothetical protein
MNKKPSTIARSIGLLFCLTLLVAGAVASWALVSSAGRAYVEPVLCTRTDGPVSLVATSDDVVAVVATLPTDRDETGSWTWAGGRTGPES